MGCKRSDRCCRRGIHPCVGPPTRHSSSGVLSSIGLRTEYGDPGYHGEVPWSPAGPYRAILPSSRGPRWLLVFSMHRLSCFLWDSKGISSWASVVKLEKHPCCRRVFTHAGCVQTGRSGRATGEFCFHPRDITPCRGPRPTVRMMVNGTGHVKHRDQA